MEIVTSIQVTFFLYIHLDVSFEEIIFKTMVHLMKHEMFNFIIYFGNDYTLSTLGHSIFKLNPIRPEVPSHQKRDAHLEHVSPSLSTSAMYAWDMLSPLAWSHAHVQL